MTTAPTPWHFVVEGDIAKLYDKYHTLIGIIYPREAELIVEASKFFETFTSFEDVIRRLRNR